MEGRVEVVVFPDVYRQGAMFLNDEEPVVVQGRLELTEDLLDLDSEEEEDEDKRRTESRRKKAKIIASRLLPLRELRYARKSSLHILLESQQATRQKLEELRDILLDYRGPCPAFLHLTEPSQGETILQMSEDFSVRPCSELVERVDVLFGGGAVSFQ
jgi:DNA polymerase III alpha subunit